MKKKAVLGMTAILAAAALTGCLHEHEFGAWEVKTPATCTEEGLQERTCECGETETEAIPAAGHSFGEWETVKEVTCTEDGEEKRTCSVCGETETRTAKSEGHSFAPATLFAPKTCSRCGLTEGEALGHVIGEEQTGAEYKFTVTDVSFTRQVSEKKGWVTYNSAEGFYLAIRLSFNNLANAPVEKWNSDRFSDMQLQYAGKYDYEGEFRVLTDDIVPLGTGNGYVLYTVPELMSQDDGKSVYASFAVDGDTYVIQVRAGAAETADGAEAETQDGEEAGDQTSETAGTEGAGEAGGTDGENGAAGEPAGEAAGETEEAAADTNTAPELAVGESRTDGENFAFTLEQVYFTNKVSEKRGNTTYSSQDGNYLVLKLKLTNLANEVIKKWNSDRITDMNLKFNEQYDYEGEFNAFVDDIVPLDTKTAYIMYSVPEVVETEEGALVATFQIDGCEFRVDCRGNMG